MTDLTWTLDTNMLVYALSPDQFPAKQRIAKHLLAKLGQPESCLIGQVVGEFMTVMLRKKAKSHAQALETVHLICQGVQVRGASTESYHQAFELVAKHHYQMWDALIIAICAEHGVKTLYSEDAGSLKRPLGVHVINPFAELELS